MGFDGLLGRSWISHFEEAVASYLGWVWTLRLEDLLILFSGLVLGATIVIYFIARLGVRIRENYSKYYTYMKELDFSALRVGEKGKPTILLQGNTAAELVDALMAYFILLLRPERFHIAKNRRRARLVMYTLWVISLLLAFLGLSLACHVTIL